MRDDIVARLRAWIPCYRADTDIAIDMAAAAADEIERLRAVVEAWLKYSQRAERDIETLRAERDEARRERDGYLEGNRQTLAALAEANEIAKRYKAERDEARKWICQLLANPTSAEGLASPCCGTSRDYAEEQGWDCFKEAR